MTSRYDEVPDLNDLAPVPLDPEVQALYYRDDKHGRHWSDAVKDYAYHVWAFVANKNATRTQLFIRNPPEPGTPFHASIDFELLPALDIPVGVIRRWASSAGEDWNARLALDFRAAEPDLFHGTVRNLAVAAFEGSDYLVRVTKGIAIADRDTVEATKIALDRVGLTPWTNTQTQKPVAPRREGSTSLKDASFEDLASRLRELASALQPDATPIDVESRPVTP